MLTLGLLFSAQPSRDGRWPVGVASHYRRAGKDMAAPGSGQLGKSPSCKGRQEDGGLICAAYGLLPERFSPSYTKFLLCHHRL